MKGAFFTFVKASARGMGEIPLNSWLNGVLVEMPVPSILAAAGMMLPRHANTPRSAHFLDSFPSLLSESLVHFAIAPD